MRNVKDSLWVVDGVCIHIHLDGERSLFLSVPSVLWSVHIKGVPMINLLKSLDGAPIINFLSVPVAAH